MVEKGWRERKEGSAVIKELCTETLRPMLVCIVSFFVSNQSFRLFQPARSSAGGGADYLSSPLLARTGRDGLSAPPARGMRAELGLECLGCPGVRDPADRCRHRGREQ